MTFTFKLSRRAALSRCWCMLLLITLITACANDLQDSSDLGAPTGVLAEGDVVVSPKNVIVEIGQMVQLTARQPIRRSSRLEQRAETTVTQMPVTMNKVPTMTPNESRSPRKAEAPIGTSTKASAANG